MKHIIFFSFKPFSSPIIRFLSVLQVHCQGAHQEIHAETMILINIDYAVPPQCQGHVSFHFKTISQI